MKADAALENYLRESAAWDADRMGMLRRSMRLGWGTAIAGWLCAIATAIGLMLLLPLKSVEPFVVRVDNSTGIVDVVPAYNASAAPDESVTRYFLTHYITVCERFNFQTAESDYEECGSFHTPQRNQAWYSKWAVTNPASPLNLHKDGGSVRAWVESVSFFKRASGITDLAQVRYLKAERSGAGGAEQISHWIATIQYAYTTPAADAHLRRWNPLGFRVMDLTSEPEAAAAGNAIGAGATALAGSR
jgi:type IV secretion system protein VirB8